MIKLRVNQNTSFLYVLLSYWFKAGLKYKLIDRWQILRTFARWLNSELITCVQYVVADLIKILSTIYFIR